MSMGAESDRSAKFWHVTHRDNVAAILENGYLPGWGDAGLGVYVWAQLDAAEDYCAGGGWDGEAAPEDLAILEIQCGPDEVEFIVPDPGWPNPDDYEHVRVWPGLDEDIAWQPQRRLLMDEKSPGEGTFGMDMNQ